MIIHIEICDSCGSVQHGLPLTSISALGANFDIGTCCDGGPFRVVRGAADKKRAFEKRVESLIAVEQQLWGGR